MKADDTPKKSMDDYIAEFPRDIQDILENIRATIRKAAPQARETISYQMPTFTLEGNLVHFAAYKNHIGFYPAPSGIEKFKQQLSVYKGAKGSVQFPLDQPIPYELIGQITEFRVRENLEKAKTKKNKGNS
ncbi:MAG: iron chaperone [Chloroflexota bacterium]